MVFRLWHSSGWLSRSFAAGGCWTISSRARNCTTPLKFHEGLLTKAGKGRGLAAIYCDKGAKLWRLTHRLRTNGIPRASIGQARLITPTRGSSDIRDDRGWFLRINFIIVSFTRRCIHVCVLFFSISVKSDLWNSFWKIQLQIFFKSIRIKLSAKQCFVRFQY